MNIVFISPHHDDETLFGAFLIQKYRPAEVVIVLRPPDPVEHKVRSRESWAAVKLLSPRTGLHYGVERSDDPNWEHIERDIRALAKKYDRAIVPATNYEGNGHTFDTMLIRDNGFGALHHDRIGTLAERAFGSDRLIRYTTYTRYGGRDTRGVPVAIEDPAWVQAKLRALAVYESQIANPATRLHFLGPLAEYMLLPPVMGSDG